MINTCILKILIGERMLIILRYYPEIEIISRSSARAFIRNMEKRYALTNNINIFVRCITIASEEYARDGCQRLSRT